MMQDEIRQNPTRPLTRRQHECVELLTDGLSSKEIARKLGISPSTVDNHIAQVMQQLGIRNRTTLRSYNFAARTLSEYDDEPSVANNQGLSENLDHTFETDDPVSVENIEKARKSILLFSGISYFILALLIVISTLITVYMIDLYRT